MANITVWHNPGCGSSKNALAYLDEKGESYDVYLYLKEKPDRATIEAVLKQAGLKPSELLRLKEALGEELGLYGGTVSEEAILDAMVANSKLIQRPLVLSPKGGVIARPKTLIDAIL
jgi:arsenate reductase